ncbi:MAG: aminotransferase class I/II-fold pyridoxal phosphate-dependent enzyme [Synergistaceae bacterium]|jgi:pyridoxal phosphate-dependent aminotransferase EpsN|nr:aminotransferase class I/II-fold pyridoxal phosphate-dependent enzyme [Synergistaceae bacterium]
MPERERIYLSPPHMGGREMEYIQEAFDTNWIAPLGPHVENFERECAEAAGVKAALALVSGTAAVHLAAKALDIKPGDLFFCSSLTFVASLAPLVQMGGVPVFIDSDPDSWNISPQALERAFRDAESSGQKPKAVILVNLYGQPCDMDQILPLCGERGVPVIEDAAESAGSLYKGRPTGSFGAFGFYSFNGNKIITTSGGGMLLSDDEEAIAKARFRSTQAREKAPWYQHSELGYNFRMSNILAGIGRAQLKLLEDRVARRRAIFDRYRKGLGDLPGISFMPESPHSRSNRWLTTLTVDPGLAGTTNLKIMDALARENIESRSVWKPMHLQPVFMGAKYYEHDGDQSRRLFENGLCLPSGSNLSLEDQALVIRLVRGAIR